MAKEYTDILQDINDALTQAVNDLADGGHYVVNKWLVTMDTTRMDATERCHHTIYDPQHAKWDIKGLVYEALDSVDSIDYFGADDEDADDEA